MYLKYIKVLKLHPGYKSTTLIRGFDYKKLLNYLNTNNCVSNIICICEKNEVICGDLTNITEPIETLTYVKNNFQKLKNCGIIEEVKDFVTIPIYNGNNNNGHWTVVIISDNYISMFDSTLQQNGKLQINNIEKYINNTINENYQIQHKDGQICGLCCAEFIIQASQCNSLQHLKDNIEIICDNVAVQVANVITKQNIEGQ